jgi:hypothetical protein
MALKKQTHRTPGLLCPSFDNRLHRATPVVPTFDAIVMQILPVMPASRAIDRASDSKSR